jgi:intraflagellar transport protein 122
MKTVLAWTDRGLARDEAAPVVVYDLCFKPDGQQLVVAAGLRVLVYDTADGDIVRTLKGHKATVYCVAYSADGKRFASGSADNTVVIWKSPSMEGMLKYTHGASIQCMAYNPVTMQLCSCTAADFGLWSPEQKSVAKQKVGSRILCCAWSANGQLLALGHANGLVSIRTKEGQEQMRVDRSAPVWCLAWNPVCEDQQCEVLAVGDWDRKLSFFQQDGSPIKSMPERTLGFDPCTLAFLANGEYMVVGGSDRRVTLWTRSGVMLGTVAERDEWVWVAKPRPKQNHVAIGDNAGVVSVHQIVFSTVHGLYQDRYAYREFMTDVVVQHLGTDRKSRVHCKEHVRKIAVYKDRLAVQLPNHILIYELISEGSGEGDSTGEELRPKLRWKIAGNLECFLLVVVSNSLVLCQEKKLQLYNFKGEREREWLLDSAVRYVKVVGGPPGREGLVIGLKSGLVLQIFLDSPFPVTLIKQTTAVRCLDLSSSRKKLAVVDENSQCLVYDLATKQLLYVEPNASSVAWNAQFEDMLCYSGNGTLNIKSGTLPTHQQKMPGFVVGFRGSKIFCLHVNSMQTIDVP